MRGFRGRLRDKRVGGGRTVEERGEKERESYPKKEVSSEEKRSCKRDLSLVASFSFTF